MLWRSVGLLLRAVRIKESALMVGFPAVGGFLGLHHLTLASLGTYVIIMVAFLLLSASVYSFNAWGGKELDARNVMHRDHPLQRGETSDYAVLMLSLALLTASLLIFYSNSERALLGAVVLWGLWLVYSHPKIQAKGKPVVGSVIHFGAGLLMFLIPYSLMGGLDERGWILALFFSLVFVGGHVNHEVMHYDADRDEGLRTSAIVFGRRRMHRISLGIFGIAYLLLLVAGLKGLASWILVIPFLCCLPPQAYCHWRTERQGLTTVRSCHYRDYYRCCFLLAGLVACSGHFLSII